MDAVILAGGLGTRLAQTVPHLPKALAPIQGIAFLDLILKQLESFKMIRKVIFAIGHKAECIELFLSKKKVPFTIECVAEKLPLGTGGALLNAMKALSSSTIFVMNGDTFFNCSFENFFRFHQEKKAEISICCKKMRDMSRYGEVEIADHSQRICSFKEKAPGKKEGWISAGIYLLETDLLKELKIAPCSIENDLFPRFLDRGIFAYRSEGEFIDIGTPESYLNAQNFLKPWIPT